MKGYGFLSFAKNTKYIQKLVDTAKKSETDAIKTVSKRVIQKTAEATGDLIGNKIANKITSASKKSLKELHSTELHSIQQINFTANLDRAGNTRIYFILEEAKETILDFSQGTVKVL